MKLINDILLSFKKEFSAPVFKFFVITTMGLMTRKDDQGITSIVRELSLEEKSYYSLLYFHKRAKYDLSDLEETWREIVLENPLIITIEGYPIFIGDHTKVSKEAKKQPGVKRQHQESETSSKANKFFGQAFGCAGAVIGNNEKQFCLPLSMKMHDGLDFLGEWEEEETGKQSKYKNSMNVQMIQQLSETISATDHGAICPLDRAFLSCPVLEVTNEHNKKYPDKPLWFVTRAKSNVKAYYPPPERLPGQRGASKKKGDVVYPFDLFEENADKFKETKIHIYGKKRKVQYLPIDLRWGQGVYQELRFVLVNINGATIVLVTNNLELKPISIIQAYASRMKIECCFREMKQQIGAFTHQFWSGDMPKLNRYAKKDAPDPVASIKCERARKNITNTVRAIHSFAFSCCVAMGILQMLSLELGASVDWKKVRYLRTYSNNFASEATIREFLRQQIYLQLEKPSQLPIMQIIQSKRKSINFDDLFEGSA